MESLNSGTNGMTLVRLRERAQITLPQEVRDALKVKQGDYLEAELVEGGVLLRPMAVVDREAARARLQDMLTRGSHWTGPTRANRRHAAAGRRRRNQESPPGAS